jgi:MscS family membrane protein
MITVCGYQIQLPSELQFLANIYGSFLATVLAWVVIAIVAYFIFSYALRWLTRRIPGEIDDIILGIVRKPLLVLIIVFGTVNSLECLQLPETTVALLERIFNTILVVIVAYFFWRVIKDVVVYYGESWARKTESRVDDIIIPIVNLFGPLLVIIFAALLILPQWGIDVTSVLLGAGVIGLVLGLALQETLSNIFSGINLLMDAPFRTGDLVVLSDGKICQVEKIGLRATQLHYLDEHSMIYVPNKDLANAMIVNITKPTVDLKVSVNVGVGYNSDLAHVEDVLREIAVAQPSVLGGIGEKVPLIEETIKELRQRTEAMSADDPAHDELLKEADQYQQALDRLQKESKLNEQIAVLGKVLEQLIQGVKDRETGGFTPAELKELHDNYVAPVEGEIQEVVACMKEWSAIPDPWAEDEEKETERERWREQNERLRVKWTALREALSRPRQEQEMRLDDMTQALLRWIRDEYKLVTEHWKEPEVTFKGFGASSIDLQLDFYVDDIRLEHFERKQRVVTEIAKEIHKRFQQENIEIPFPQMDVWFKNELHHSTDSKSKT